MGVTLRTSIVPARRGVAPVAAERSPSGDPQEDLTASDADGQVIGFHDANYQVAWRDFFAPRETPWPADSEHDGVKLCLNFAGEGFIASTRDRARFSPNTAGFFVDRRGSLTGGRKAGQRHQYLSVRLSGSFLRQHLSGVEDRLHPLVRTVTSADSYDSAISDVGRMNASQRQALDSLRHPPPVTEVRPIWYQCKAVELAVMFLFQPSPDGEMFCTRQKRLARERVEQVTFLLRQNLAEPPTLEDLGRKIGCSHFYLSRIFSNYTGQTITQCLRQLRMEKAAELLREGEYNVTEVALEVGYASPSHFSQAFHATFGCCPGLYPVATATQRARSRTPAR